VLESQSAPVMSTHAGYGSGGMYAADHPASLNPVFCQPLGSAFVTPPDHDSSSVFHWSFIAVTFSGPHAIAEGAWMTWNDSPAMAAPLAFAEVTMQSLT
jgi:hypothetical protein